MSFSSDLKAELCSKNVKARHCMIAELTGFLMVNGRVRENSLEIRVENKQIEEKMLTEAMYALGISKETFSLVDEKIHHRKLVLSDPEATHRLMSNLHLVKEGRFLTFQSPPYMKECCGRSLIRGVFLGGGSIGEPSKAYQMEFLLRTRADAKQISNMLSSLQIQAKALQRKDERFVVYVKDGDSISNLLGIMGASGAMMEFENTRILKDIRNSINREVNCDTANSLKTANTGARQVDDIQYIARKQGLSSLPVPLQEICQIRLQFPYLSLQELGEEMDPPLGKSGVRHRLKKISDLADELRKGE